MHKRHAHAHDWLYPMQFACFGCRKGYKQHMRLSQFGKHHPKCPQCGARMWEMGRAFKAPPRSGRKQWKKVELLVRSGFVFYPNQFGWARSPRTLRDAVMMVETRRGRSAGERLLKAIGRRRRRPGC